MLQDMISIATQWQSAETAMAQFIVDNDSSETDSESEEQNDMYYERTPNRSKGPVISNLNYKPDQTEEHTQINGNKRGKGNNPTDTSTIGDDGHVRVKNHMSRRPLDWKPKMHDFKITPVPSGYQLKFIQFSSNVYPDKGCTETVIAASMTKRQRLSVSPTNRQLQCAEGRQWKTTGLTTFDVEYQGRTARVEALVLPTLEDGIFLGWATLRDLISGPNPEPIHFDKQFATPNTKLRRGFLKPTLSQNHADTIRLEEFFRRQEYMPNKPCGVISVRLWNFKDGGS